ncbi:sorting nexin-25 isoform X2 [Hydra vulgaris]|uniref:Sorting nexin-25 isoform X2 n=1 Tax=Hydra vulgaris TaxID=6087 RepID=A0ABM4D814_HYDVU
MNWNEVCSMLKSLKKSNIFSISCVSICAVLYSVGWLQLLISWLMIILIMIFSLISGLALVLCRGKHREPPAPSLLQEEQAVSEFLNRMAKSYNKHYYKHRIVISKDLDNTIQQVIDLVIHDFCLSWFRDVGKDETAFVEILNKELWTVIENLIIRLNEVDSLNFLCNSLVMVLHNHFHDLRLSDARQFPGQTKPFLLHPCLKDHESEVKYLRLCADCLLVTLLPESDSNCLPMRYAIREVLANFIFLATAESICDPDYINQTLVIYLEDKEKSTETQKQQYAYAETYEEFIKMINTTSDIETLKQIRYHTIAEIMQATVIHNSKNITEHDGISKSGKKNKKEALQDRNLKRYINQCRVSKLQCEKRIRQLGGPDYRVYGLGQGKPFQANNEQESPRRGFGTKSSKVLAFNDIMDNSLARSFFMLYLQRNEKENLLGIWIAIEKFRLTPISKQLQSANEIFQEYVTPSADKAIKFNSKLVRGMEEFIYGNGDPEVFYEAQKEVYSIMEESIYPEFVLSHDYTQFVCQLESAMDDMRAQLGEDLEMQLDWSDGLNFKERRNAEALRAAMPSNIEERNDFAVRSLKILDQKINAKTQALELLKRALPVDVQEVEKLVFEIDHLNTERRHLEFHIERTDLWCEMLGRWKASIVSVQNKTDEESNPIFVICVSCDEREQSEPKPSSAGWVICRTLNDFKNLHDKIRECCNWMSKELPVSSKKWYHRKLVAENLETLKESLQEYLDIILADERLSHSDEIYIFLIPSPDHLRVQSSKNRSIGEIKTPLSLIKTIKGSIQNISFPDIFISDGADGNEMEPGVEENSIDRKDSIAEPLYTLIGELFELKGVFKLLRKTLISFVQVTFGGTINRHLREFVGWLLSEPMLIYYIDNFKQSMWPKGKLAPYPPPRTDLEKLRTREHAKEKVMKSIPDVLQNLVGKRNSRLGFLKLFEAFQDFRSNKHLFYMVLELIIVTICPEIKNDDVFQNTK